MRLDIRYQMRFRYEANVREAHNEIRVRPRDLPEQRLLAHRLTTVPVARVLSFTDYWGTTVDHFGHVPDHDELEVIAEAAVETRTRPDVATADLGALSDNDFVVAHAELLGRSAHVAWDDRIAALARDAIDGAADVRSAVDEIVAATRAALVYEHGSTKIGIPLPELVTGGKGVCQDFAHLSIGLLRSAGIPARYVSGYLFAADETAVEDDDATVVVQTHAWVEAAIPGQGWLAVDPTNDRPVGLRHVVIGFGRDYDDVAPVRGIYQGDSTPEVDATVEIRRMETLERTTTDRPRRRPGLPLAMPAMPDASVAQQQQQQ